MLLLLRSKATGELFQPYDYQPHLDTIVATHVATMTTVYISSTAASELLETVQ